MIKKINFIIILLILSFFCCQPVLADMAPPDSPSDECYDNEIFVEKGKPAYNYNYIHKRDIHWSTEGKFIIGRGNVEYIDGYCIRLDDYCLKNHCDLETNLKLLSFPKFHIFNIIVNLILNGIIILIFLIIKRSLKIFIKFKSIIQIIGLTILGYMYDMVAIYLIALPILRKLNVPGNKLFGYYMGSFYKYTNEQLLAEPFSLLIIGATVFVLVAITFYFIYSKNISQSVIKRIFFSLLFGLISNPVWYLLYLKYL